MAVTWRVSPPAGTVTVGSEDIPRAIAVAITEGAGRGRVASGFYEVAGGRLKLYADFGPEYGGAGPAGLVELERVPAAGPAC